MSRPTLEERVESLETRLAQLQASVALAQRPGKDWRRTIGAFTDDAGMQDILKEAMRLREADRQKARSQRRKKRKPAR